MNRPVLIVFLACAFLLSPACKRRQPQPPTIPPAPAPSPQEPESTEPKPTEPSPEAEPEIEPKEPLPEGAPPPAPRQQGPPSPPEPAAPPLPTEPEASPPPLAEPQPPPRLAPLLSPAERDRLLREIDEFLAQARRNVRIIEQRRLSPEDQVALNRVRTFINQAQAARMTDLPTARGLAARAAVLAEELLRSSR